MITRARWTRNWLTTSLYGTGNEPDKSAPGDDHGRCEDDKDDLNIGVVTRKLSLLPESDEEIYIIYSLKCIVSLTNPSAPAILTSP
jgi:hypothetical protein